MEQFGAFGIDYSLGGPPLELVSTTHNNRHKPTTRVTTWTWTTATEVRRCLAGTSG